MWLSSIAVTVMMIPIAQVVLEETAVEQLEHDSEHGSKGPMVSQQQQQQQQHLAEQVTINLEEPDNLDKGARRQWESPENERRQRGFRKMLLLSVAYSANIGGTGTMTGEGRGSLKNLLGKQSLRRKSY